MSGELATSAAERDGTSISVQTEAGTVRIDARPEGGHYTFVEALTDQMGESRMDRNVKKFFVRLHKRTDPSHALDASF